MAVCDEVEVSYSRYVLISHDVNFLAIWRRFEHEAGPLVLIISNAEHATGVWQDMRLPSPCILPASLLLTRRFVRVRFKFACSTVLFLLRFAGIL